MLQRRLSTLAIIVSGLVLAQAISTAFVYLSNVDLHHTTRILDDAGYLTVPNTHVMPSLLEFGPAFHGGLFFTLTLGSGLTLASLFMGLIRTRFPKSAKIPLVILCFLQAICLAGINKNGLCIVSSLYFVVIPIVIFVMATKLLSQHTENKKRISPLIHVIPLLILSVLWFTQTSKNVFVDMRDIFLLSNPIGIKVNRFYYDYTLYPAEAYKTLNQKLIKTCNLEKVNSPVVRNGLKQKLIRFDYAETAHDTHVDLRITQEGDELILHNRGKTILTTTSGDFLRNPRGTLDSFSILCDRNGFLRNAVYISLLLGFPLLLYILIHTFLSLTFSLFMNASVSSSIISALGLIIGVLMLLPIYQASNIEVDVNDITKILGSDNKQARIAVLKLIVRNRLEITEYESYKKVLRSSSIPELYWGVKALGNSRNPKVFDDLIGILNSPHDNVVCMAYYALGRRGDKRAAHIILKRIETSNHWYRQWYGYRALRNLGWKQRASN